MKKIFKSVSLMLVMAMAIAFIAVPGMEVKAASKVVTKVVEKQLKVTGYDKVYSFSEGLAAVYKKGKGWGFINKDGKEVIACKYGWVSSFSDGLAAVEKNGKYGFINKDGKEIVACKYDDLEGNWDGYQYRYVVDGLAEVVNYGKNYEWKYGLVSEKGEVLACKYGYIVVLSDGYALVGKERWEDGIIVNKEGKRAPEFGEYESARSYSDGLAEVWRDRRWVYVNKEGKEVPDAKVGFVDGYKWTYEGVENDRKYGFINKEGKIVVECKYDMVDDFFKDGLAWVQMGKKYGFVNTEGKEVVECKYDEAERFSDGLARVKKGKKYGYVNAEGKEVVKCGTYSSGVDRIFKNGNTVVKKKGKWYILTAK